MKKFFDTMFSRTPDEILDGVYTFRIPWLEEEQKRFGAWTDSEEDLAGREAYSREHFLSDLEKRMSRPETTESELSEILFGIAASGKPVVDIASSERMGLLPCLLKYNPHLPCLATDADVHAMRRLRRRLRENLPGNNVGVARLDALDLPFSDDSVPCVTGYLPLTGVTTFRNWIPAEECDPDVRSFRDFTEKLERTVVREVYRVLKPGGIFVLEDGGKFEWDYDLRRVCGFFETKERLYGLYSREEVLKRLAEIEEEWHRYGMLEDKLLSAGFERIYGRRIAEKLPVSVIADALGKGEPVDPASVEEDEGGIDLYAPLYVYVLQKPIK